jgi:hypothetical protein
MIYSPRDEYWSRCWSLPSASSGMIALRPMVVQLRLDLAESSAPAVALWELVDEEHRQSASTLLAALIAQTIAPEAVSDDRASLRGAGAAGGGDD